MDVVKRLQELGNLLVKCREMPAWFLDSWSTTSYSDFHIIPEPDWDGDNPPSDQTLYFKYESGNAIAINAKNYPFHAQVLLKEHSLRGVKTQFDEKPALLVAYYFSRSNLGCVGESLKRYTAHDFKGIETRSILGAWAAGMTTLLEIGRNEHYNPEIEESDPKSTVIVKEPVKMKIAPLLPEDDLDNLVRRFENLVRCFEKSKTKL